MPKILDKALRTGRGPPVQAVRQARRGHQPLRARAGAARRRRAQGAVRRAARARAGRRVARRPAAGVLRHHARGRPAHDGHAPLRRAADRRHGPALGRHRRDEDGRGQDAHRHAGRRPQRDRRPRRPRHHGQRLPGPPRRGVDEPDLRLPRADRRRPAEPDGARRQGRRLRRRHHLRHQLGVRLRLPARQHGGQPGGEGPARPAHHGGRQGGRHPRLRRSSTRSTTSSSTRPAPR